MFFAIIVGLAVVVALVRRVDLAAVANTRFRGLWWLLAAVILRFGLDPVSCHLRCSWPPTRSC